MKIIRPLLKLSLGGGAVYLAVNQKVFSGQEESVSAVKKITESIPGLQTYIEKIPGINISKDEVIDYWNSGVKVTFSALADLPEDGKELFWKGYGYAKEGIQNQLKPDGK